MSTRREIEMKYFICACLFLAHSARPYISQTCVLCFIDFTVLSATEDELHLLVKDCFASCVLACISDTEIAYQKSTASSARTNQVDLPFAGRL